MHLYQLGQYFHKRYGKLIGDGYQQDKVYVLSTDHDRAIMSAQANLAGMFEPNDTEVWHEQILWQPIPVHTLPMVLDNILRPRYEDRCPRYDKMYNWYIKKSPEAEKMYEKYGHHFKEWAEKSGRKVKHIEHVFSIYKKLLSQVQQNQTLVSHNIKSQAFLSRSFLKRFIKNNLTCMSIYFCTFSPVGSRSGLNKHAEKVGQWKKSRQSSMH